MITHGRTFRNTFNLPQVFDGGVGLALHLLHIRDDLGVVRLPWYDRNIVYWV